MRGQGRRVLLYGTALVIAAALGGLTWRKAKLENRALVGTLLNGGELLAKLGAYEKARAYARRVQELDPGNLDALLLAAFCHQREGRLREALAAYKEAYARARDPRVRDYLELVVADTERMAGEREAARRRLRAFRERRGTPPHFCMVWGQLLVDEGRRADALPWFERAARAPEPPTGAHAALVRTHLELGHKEAALKVLEEAVRRGVPGRGLYYTLACVRRELGDRAGAAAALKQALQREPRRTRLALQADREAWAAAGLLPAQGKALQKRPGRADGKEQRRGHTVVDG